MSYSRILHSFRWFNKPKYIEFLLISFQFCGTLPREPLFNNFILGSQQNQINFVQKRRRCIITYRLSGDFSKKKKDRKNKFRLIKPGNFQELQVHFLLSLK